MTREKAIEVLENRLSQCQYVYDTSQFPDISYPGAKREIDALEIALSALRPVSREQVEKVWRGQWVKCKHADYYVCNKCSTVSKIGEDEFCKSCGAPMTDEAVEMVMERMEALHNAVD